MRWLQVIDDLFGVAAIVRLSTKFADDEVLGLVLWLLANAFSAWCEWIGHVAWLSNNHRRKRPRQVGI
jgi:hypothetical protein